MSEGPELQDLDGAWERLRTHLEWADSFWLAFVFSSDPRAVEQLRERSEAKLSEAGRSCRVWKFSSPEEIDALVVELLTGEPSDVHWIDLVRFDDRSGGPGWSGAWERLLRRLNERREVLRRRAPRGGLVLATTAARLESSPQLAPDLWTIRSLVLRVESLPRGPRMRAGGITFEYQEQRELDPQLARQAVRAARAKGDSLALASALSALAYVTPEEEAIGVRRQAVDLYRQQYAAEGSHELRGALAWELARLGPELAALGRHQLALEATKESVDHARALVAADPDAHLPFLAASLNNHGIHLGNLGRHEEALAVARESVENRRKLLVARPDAGRLGLAASLLNLTGALRRIGHAREAVATGREGLALYEQLDAEQPGKYTPNIAGGYLKLAAALSDVGQPENAVAAAEEGLELYLQLAHALPDIFHHPLAHGLVNLAMFQLELGRNEAALAASQRSVEVFEQLSKERPDAFLSQLARSLGVRGFVEVQSGKVEQAAESFANGLRTILPLLKRGQLAPFENLTKRLVQNYRGACTETRLPLADDLVDLLAQFPPTD